MKGFFKTVGDKVENMFKHSAESQEAYDNKMAEHKKNFDKTVSKTAKEAYESADLTINYIHDWLKKDFVDMVEQHQKALEEREARMDEYAEKFGKELRSTPEYQWLKENIDGFVETHVSGNYKALEAEVTQSIKIYQLNEAISHGKNILVEAMIKDNKIDINWIPVANQHPMLAAAESHNIDAIKSLMESKINCTECAKELIEKLKSSTEPVDAEALELVTEYLHNQINELAGIVTKLTEQEAEQISKDEETSEQPLKEELDTEETVGNTGDDNTEHDDMHKQTGTDDTSH